MENITIRKIQKEDIPAVIDIQIRGWQTAYKGIIDDSYLAAMNREERIQKREQDYLDSSFIVAESAGNIVGFCRYIDTNTYTPEVENADCELMAIYVDPDLKRKGIGKNLFEYATADFLKKNKKKMVLWCLKDNTPSKIFYKKMGGRMIKERPIKINQKNYAEVCFAYDIQQHSSKP